MSSQEGFRKPPSEQQVKDLEADILEKERTVRALESFENQEPGSSALPPERLKAMREAVAQKRGHFRDLLQKHEDSTSRVRKVESDTQYFRLTERIKRDTDDLEREMKVLLKYHSDPDALEVYKATRERMLNLRDRYENLLRSIPAESPARDTTRDDEQLVRESFQRMLQMDDLEAKPEGPEKMPLEIYDGHVREILSDVVALQSTFEYTLKKGLTKAKLQMLHDGLDASQDKLQELDGQTDDAARSRERRELMKLINQLRSDYPATLRQVGGEDSASPTKITELSSIRDLHQRVKASYATVQHTLTVDQRREMRVRIASLSSLVSRAEDEHRKAANFAVFAKISHATEHAPAIAHAAANNFMRTPPQEQGASKKGPFATLAAAFRLK